MAKRCTRCGNFLMDDERFCTRCGENVSTVSPAPSSAPAPAGFPDNNGYTQNHAQPGVPGNQPYTYAQPVPAAQQEELTLGKWVLTVIVTTFFGIISLVFLFIWGFGDGPESRKNYCKAMLIVRLVEIGLTIVLFFVWIGIFSSIIGGSGLIDILEDYEQYYESGQFTFASLSTLFGK